MSRVEARKNLLEFLGDLGHDSIALRGPIPKSAGYISPGDVFTFYYKPNQWGRNDNPHPLVLVVANDRGKGIFISPTGNRLVSAFSLNRIQPGTAAIILKQLYRNRNIDYYGIIGLLHRFLGDEYRTYNIRYMNELEEVLIDKKKLKFGEEDEESILDG